MSAGKVKAGLVAACIAAGLSWAGCTNDEFSESPVPPGSGAGGSDVGGSGAQGGAGAQGGSASQGGSAGQGGTPLECQPPLSACDGACVFTDSDVEHCGDCDTACATGEICLEGLCTCGPDLVACTDGCFDVSSDVDHCGDCDIVCLVGQACVSGACSDCPVDQEPCLEQGVCADLLTDDQNCGGCGADCGAGGDCVDGMCVCPDTLVSCPAGCVDLSDDPANCGDCDASCLGGQACVSGNCADCPVDTTACVAQGVCADLTTDDANCGQCGKICGPGGNCESGNCVCQAGYVDCGPIFGCVSLADDPNNCGGCGERCPADATCQSGNCVCPTAGEILCDGHCTDPTTDPWHCGSCGNDCDPVYGECVSGSCGCLGGLSACGGANRCTDTLEDPNHCGSCGAPCGDREICLDGQCECKPGLTLVDAVCVDLQSNPQSCGTPGHGCQDPTPFCENGSCVADCNQLPDNCGQACVDQDTDPLHCGGCDPGDVCESDEVCIEGNCRPWRVGVGCNSCPCPLSCEGDFDQCCVLPDAGPLVACVDAFTCPQ